MQEDLIYRRHSTRNYDPDYTISRANQERILRAGLQAPSPKNRQPWKLVVLDRREDICVVADILEEEIKQNRELQEPTQVGDLEMALASVEIIRSVSVLVLVCYERDERNRRGGTMDWTLSLQGFEAADLQSIGACVENMLLTAEEMGIASLWLCDVLYAQKRLREELHLGHPMVAAVAFGKALAARTPRKPLEQKVCWLHG